MQQINIPLILNSLGFEGLNEIQQASLEANAKNDNVVLLSATGSGKTLAFLLPLLETLDPEINNVQALIIVPSRELAIQIDDVFRKMQTGFKVTLCYGGHKRETEENNLKEAPALIIGTAGLPHILMRFFTVKMLKKHVNQVLLQQALLVTSIY